MIPKGTLLAGHYNFLIVALSVFIPILGAYVALDLAVQARLSTGRARRNWLMISTLAMAIAIWTMHYTAMLAFNLRVSVRYQVPTAILCFCIAIFASALSLYVATRERLGWRLAMVAALFSGAAIVGLHYTAMASMQMAAMKNYTPLSVVLASAVAVGASLLSLWLIFRPREQTWVVTWDKAASAVVMGAAIAGMHYTAMSGTTFFAAPAHQFARYTVEISSLGTSASDVAVIMVLLFILVTGATVERHGYASELKNVNEALQSEISERRRAEEELGRLSGQLLRAQDEERHRIARDLHDSTAQNLVLLTAAMERLRSSVRSAAPKTHRLFSEAQQLAAGALREVRTLSYVLYPPMLDESGLGDAIQDYVEGYSERSGVDVTVQVSRNFGRLQREAEMALFRVVQESLTNVQRHSGSRRAHIRLTRMQDRIVLEIRDEGDRASDKANTSTRPPPGVGIPSMRERVKQLGGELDIFLESSGTTVRAIIPTT